MDQLNNNLTSSLAYGGSYNNYSHDIVYSPKLHSPKTVIDTIRGDDFYQKYQLYQSAEVFWPRLLSNINYIKSSVSRKKLKLNIFEKNNKDAETKYDLILQAQENFRGKPIENINSFKQMIEDCVTAYAYGISLQEIKFEQTDDYILPYGSCFVSANNFDVYGSYKDYKLQLKLHNGPMDIPVSRFISAIYRNRSTTNQTTYGMYQGLMWPFVARMYAQDYFLRYAELYSIPHRTITFPKDASKELVNTLNTAATQFGYGGWMTMPEGCKMEVFSQTTNTTGNAPQAIIDWADKVCDITMLGNNLSTEVNGGSYAAASAHQEKENNVISNVTDFVIDILNNQFIRNVVLANDMLPDNLPYYTVDTLKDVELLQKKLNIINQLKSLNLNIDTEQLIEELTTYGINVKINNNESNSLQNNTESTNTGSDNK